MRMLFICGVLFGHIVTYLYVIVRHIMSYSPSQEMIDARVDLAVAAGMAEGLDSANG